MVSQLVAQHLDIERAKSAQAAQNAHLFSQQLTLHAAREREEEKLRSELARRQEHRDRGRQRAPSVESARENSQLCLLEPLRVNEAE